MYGTEQWLGEGLAVVQVCPVQLLQKHLLVVLLLQLIMLLLHWLSNTWSGAPPEKGQRVNGYLRSSNNNSAMSRR